MSFLSKTFKYVNEAGEAIVFNLDSGFIINKPNGIDTLQISLSQATGINQVGATIQSANVQSRPVTVSGRLYGNFQKENKDRLLSVIRPDLKAKFYADDYYLEVRPTSTPTIEPLAEFAFFQFSILAAYPYWQKDDAAKINMANVSAGFKFPWNISKAYRFGYVSETQFFNVINNGQIPVPFTVEFFARNTIVNPKITNASNGKFLLLNATMEAGEKIVLEITHDRTYVTSSIRGDIRGALNLRSTFNRLEVGDNVLKPEAESGGNDLEISIKFATEIVGISL